jgi:diguanylate cyclase (GGDEF)-like protein/PAS domain S-box-containing protein
MLRLNYGVKALWHHITAFWSHSIRRQLVLSFGLLIILVMMSFSCVMYVYQKDFLYKTDTERAKGLANALAASSAVLVLANDAQGLQKILSGFAKLPDIQSAMVLSAQGSLLAASHMADFDQRRRLPRLGQQASTIILLDSANLLDVVAPIMFERKPVAWARVELKRQSSNANLQHLKWTGVQYSLFALAASFLLSALLAWRLTRRLYQLIKVTLSVEKGQRDVRCAVIAHDEVANLGRHFNHMLDSLSRSEQELSRMNSLYAAWTESSEIIVRQKNPTLLLKNICQILANRVPFELVWVGVPGADGWVDKIADSGVSAAYLDNIKISVDVSKQNSCGPVAKVLRTGSYQVMNHFLQDAGAFWYTQAAQHGFNSVAAFPLFRAGKVYGCIAVYSVASNFFTQDLIGLMSGLANDVTFALENIDRETQQHSAAMKLEQAATVFEFSTEGIIVTDAERKIISVNKSFSEITGYSASEALGCNPKMLASGLQDGSFYQDMWISISRNGSWQGELWNKRKDGEIYPEALTIICVKNDQGAVMNYLAIFSDISERKSAEERILQLANYDVLTGLPNRILFNDRLEQALIHSQHSQCALYLLFLDIDRFKQINDTLGHGVGDQLLQIVAERLKQCVREQDTVSRQGGDEFIVALPDASAAEASMVAQNILQYVLQPYVIEQHDLRITVSIGIAAYPEHAQDAETLVKYADVAMYQAKASGRNRYLHFDAGMNTSSYERLQMENALRSAVERDEMRIVYQPQVNLSDGKISGCEALVRWQHPTLGLIYPEKFIPLAEETGLIVSINDWVLEQAIKQCHVWQKAGYAPIQMSVNFSAMQFGQSNLILQITDLLNKYQVPPAMLDIELTESTLMQGVERTLTTLHELAALGVTISIDDFGTGYSSLSYLKRFPIQQLKIDQSFIRDVTTDPSDATMVRTIVLMAKSLKLHMIAEGVENAAQVAFLQQCGCERAQGYYYSKPLTAEAFEKLI